MSYTNILYQFILFIFIYWWTFDYFTKESWKKQPGSELKNEPEFQVEVVVTSVL